MTEPVNVAVTGFSWGPWLLGPFNLMFGGVFGGALVAWLRTRPRLKEIEQAGEVKLIDTLNARVDKLEKEISEQRSTYERRIDMLLASNEAVQRVQRHELNNVKMRFRALVMLLKRLPDPPPMLIAILSDIEAMEAEQLRAEALEKGAQSAVKITAAGGDKI